MMFKKHKAVFWAVFSTSAIAYTIAALWQRYLDHLEKKELAEFVPTPVVYVLQMFRKGDVQRTEVSTDLAYLKATAADWDGVTSLKWQDFGGHYGAHATFDEERVYQIGIASMSDDDLSDDEWDDDIPDDAVAVLQPVEDWLAGSDSNVEFITDEEMLDILVMRDAKAFEAEQDIVVHTALCESGEVDCDHEVTAKYERGGHPEHSAAAREVRSDPSWGDLQEPRTKPYPVGVYPDEAPHNVLSKKAQERALGLGIFETPEVADDFYVRDHSDCFMFERQNYGLRGCQVDEERSDECPNFSEQLPGPHEPTGLGTEMIDPVFGPTLVTPVPPATGDYDAMAFRDRLAQTAEATTFDELAEKADEHAQCYYLQREGHGAATCLVDGDNPHNCPHYHEWDVTVP